MPIYAVLVLITARRYVAFGSFEFYKDNILEWCGFPEIKINFNEKNHQLDTVMGPTHIRLKFLNYLAKMGFSLTCTEIEKKEEEGEQLTLYKHFLVCPENLDEVMDEIQSTNMDTGEKYSDSPAIHAKHE